MYRWGDRGEGGCEKGDGEGTDLDVAEVGMNSREFRMFCFWDTV